MAEDAITRINRSEGQRARYWQCPPEYLAMYRNFVGRFGRHEARRLIVDHARHVEARRRLGIKTG